MGPQQVGFDSKTLVAIGKRAGQSCLVVFDLRGIHDIPEGRLQQQYTDFCDKNPDDFVTVTDANTRIPYSVLIARIIETREVSPGQFKIFHETGSFVTANPEEFAAAQQKHAAFLEANTGPEHRFPEKAHLPAGHRNGKSGAGRRKSTPHLS